MLAFPPNGARPGFWRLFGVYLASDFVNTMLPAANVGGELAKSYLLRPHTPVSDSAPSVVANKTVEFLSGIVFASAGVVAALLSMPIRGEMRTALTAAVILVSAASVLAYLAQRKRPMSRLLNLLIRLRIRSQFLESKRDAVERMDSNLSAFYGTHRGRFLGCFALHLLAWVLGAIEIFLIVRLMGVDVAFTTAFIIAALGFVIRTAFFFVPANLGIFEASNTYLFILLGLAPALGLSVALIQRLRRLLWVGAGMAVVSFSNTGKR